MPYRSDVRRRREPDFDPPSRPRRLTGDRYGRPRQLTGDGYDRPPGRRAPERRGARPGSHRWQAMSRLARAAYVGSICGTVLVVLVSLGLYGVYLHLDGNINVVSVNGLSHRSVYGVQNILLLGSQTRKGQGRGFGTNPSLNTSNSDNILLVHLDARHTHAIILSIPRDTIVYEPGCKARPGIGDGIWGPYQSAIIDGAMNIGGPSCAVSTVGDLTGVRLDHFVMFDFNSFRTMVDALGGVEVCVPPGGYHDPWSHLNLSGGRHLLTYNAALAYVRTRHGVSAEGDTGGDLPRIMLQQAFVSSVIQKVNTQGILGNSVQLLKIADTATKALTVDQGLDSVSKLLGLARTLAHLRAKHVTLITMPTVPDPSPAESGRLLPEEPQDDVIFQMITDGQRWSGHLPTLPAGQVKVKVLNGTGAAGLAGQAAGHLRKLGFDVTAVGNAAPASTTTVTYSGTAQADSAYTLMLALKGTPAAQNLLQEPAPQTGVAGTVTLVIGSDWAGVNPPPPAAQAGQHGKPGHASRAGKPSQPAASSQGSAGAVQTRNAGANICSGLPSANPDPGTPP
jgi:LCP family protein required for cell wall assembly